MRRGQQREAGTFCFAGLWPIGRWFGLLLVGVCHVSGAASSFQSETLAAELLT
jgi:hypothetical protein